MAASLDYEMISLRKEILELKSYYSRRSGAFTTVDYTGTATIVLTKDSVSGGFVATEFELIIAMPTRQALYSCSLDVNSNPADRNWSVSYIPRASLWGIVILYQTTNSSDINTLNNGGTITVSVDYTITTTSSTLLSGG